MKQLKPKQIILHCSLHKTGATYLQQNFKNKHNTSSNNQFLYLGATALKKQLSLLWKYLQWGNNKTKSSQRLTLQNIKALSRQADNSPRGIYMILISFEANFETLRTDLVQRNHEKNYKRETDSGRYHYIQKKMKRLMSGLEHTFRSQENNWTICFSNMKQDDFIHSCNIQPTKEVQYTTRLSLEEFSKITNFSYTNPRNLHKALSPLKENRNVKIIPLGHESNSDRSDSTIYQYNFIPPDNTKQIISIPTNKSDSKNIHKMIKPGISVIGLNLVKEERSIFTRQKWKLYRKFLEKNFIKSN